VSASISEKMRDLMFTTSPAQLKLTLLPCGLWAGTMEFEVSGTWVTLLAIVDGTTSLYFGSGGGIIGAGGHAGVREAAQMFLETLDKASAGFTKVSAYPLPGAGRLHFYALKADGVYASPEIDESEFAKPGHELLPLYAAAQNLITQIRLANQRGN
jgi:hypothetical protein